jgi:hypothetical protein
MQVHMGEVNDYGVEEGVDEFWDKEIVWSTPTTVNPTGTPTFDPTSCNPNASYASGTPCALFQTGVDVGQILIQAQQRKAAGGAGAPKTEAQWIKGVPNIAVILAGAAAAFIALKR